MTVTIPTINLSTWTNPWIILPNYSMDMDNQMLHLLYLRNSLWKFLILMAPSSGWKKEFIFFLVLIGKKAGVAKILRSFSKLCVPLLGIKGPKFIIFGQFCKWIISKTAHGIYLFFSMGSWLTCIKETIVRFSAWMVQEVAKILESKNVKTLIQRFLLVPIPSIFKLACDFCNLGNFRLLLEHTEKE